MKGERAKKVFLYFWRILVIVLLNVMILLMLWNSGAAYALSKYGSTGDEVTQIQTKLQQLGYYSGDLDGIFGTGTKNAVLAFQRDQGLDADGIAGKNTLSALGITSGGSSQGGYGGFSESDVNLLASIISAEARGEPYEG